MQIRTFWRSLSTILQDKENNVWYIQHGENIFSVPYFNPGLVAITRVGDKIYGNFFIDNDLIKHMAAYLPDYEYLSTFPAEKPLSDIFWDKIHKIKQQGDYSNEFDRIANPGYDGCVPIEIEIVIDPFINISKTIVEYNRERYKKLNPTIEVNL